MTQELIPRRREHALRLVSTIMQQDASLPRKRESTTFALIVVEIKFLFKVGFCTIFLACSKELPYTDAQLDSICKHSRKVELLNFLKQLSFEVNNDADNWYAVKYDDLDVFVSERIMVNFKVDKNENISNCDLRRELTGP